MTMARQSSQQNSQEAAASQMGQIMDDYLNQVSRGASPSIEQYAARYPELADVIRKLLPMEFIGTSSQDEGNAIAVDTTGFTYVTGYQSRSGSKTDAFVTKLNSNLQTAGGYPTFFDGGSDEAGHDVAVDDQENAYITGTTESVDFTTEDAIQGTYSGEALSGSADAFVARLAADGTITDSTYLGGEGSTESGFGIFVNAPGVAWVAGYTDSSDFPTTGDAYDDSWEGPTGSGGVTDPFLTRISFNEVAPFLSINDVSVLEGDAGTVSAEFTVTRSGDPDVPVSVSYSTADGTATQGDDYIAISSTTLNFAAGETQKTVSVTVVGDVEVEEPDETFVVNLSNAVGATISDNQGVGTIQDDDGTAPTAHVGDLDASTTSGRGGKWNATVTITVHAAGHGTISDAAVTGSWSAGASGASSCTTDGSGQCSVTKSNISKHSSSATFIVDAVSHVDHSYEEGDNHDPDGDSNGTTITVSKPTSASQSSVQRLQATTEIARDDEISAASDSPRVSANGSPEQINDPSLWREAVDAALGYLDWSEGELAKDEDDFSDLLVAVDALFSEWNLE